MKEINLNEVKTQFSKYIDLVEAGETVIVCKRNVPVAELRPIMKKARRAPRLGWASIKMSSSFDAPLSEKDLALWEQGHDRDPLRDYAPKASRLRK